MIAAWRDGEVRDLHAEMMRLTLAVVSEVLLGSDASDFSSEFGRALAEVLEVFVHRMDSLFPLPDGVPTPVNLRLRRATRRLDRIVARIIASRRVAGRTESAGREPDLLDRLLGARDAGAVGMTDRQLRDEVITFLAAGHETTAVALSWAWYLLSLHAEVRRRLLAEVDSVLGEAPFLAGAADRLPCIEQVLLETLRLYPPAYAIGREAVTDCRLGGYDIPAGSTVMISQWVLHRDPRYFSDPDRFDPDRWAGGLARRLPRGAYFPFSSGPRNCVGASFAMQEAAVLMVAVAQSFTFELVDAQAVVPWPSITLRPRDGIKAVVRARRRGTPAQSGAPL
jgi:cytochrome P450